MLLLPEEDDKKACTLTQLTKYLGRHVMHLMQISELFGGREKKSHTFFYTEILCQIIGLTKKMCSNNEENFSLGYTQNPPL